ncbi:MAG: PilZ domain-containing protein [Thermoanaerobaculales bacterium]|nr:PilZ domain-containing protein [Thermoanaerobaculales bacterium]
MTKNIVLTRMDQDTFARAASALNSDEITLHHAPWDDNTLDLVQSTKFDVIIIGFPGPITPLRRFVECVRAPGSACQSSGVILLADPQHIDAAQAFVGVGINRAIPSDNAEELLAASITELASVAPRLALRAPTRVVLKLEQRPLRTFCQTENISESGMLLRGFGHYPPGTTIDFEINIPGQSDPIRGTATIARTTNVTLERMEGVGARFQSFTGQDGGRLTEYLNPHLH